MCHQCLFPLGRLGQTLTLTQKERKPFFWPAWFRKVVSLIWQVNWNFSYLNVFTKAFNNIQILFKYLDSSITLL